jgi:hypothetical protein
MPPRVSHEFARKNLRTPHLEAFEKWELIFHASDFESFEARFSECRDSRRLIACSEKA